MDNSLLDLLLKPSCLVHHLRADGAVPVAEPISSTSAREGLHPAPMDAHQADGR
jgi:hypothetical protein